MVAESLLELAKRSCAKYGRNITDIGGAPYELVREALLKIESPEQLVGSAGLLEIRTLTVPQ